MNTASLEITLKELRLSGLCQALGVRLQEAAANRLGHAEFLELILQDELNVRQQRQLERHTKAADFRHLKTLEDFDWSFNPSVHKKEIFDLASGKFIREAKDVLFLGPPGVGKTHLTQAIGSEATHRPATRCDRGPCHVIHPRPPDYPTPRTRPLIRKLSLRIFVRSG